MPFPAMAVALVLSAAALAGCADGGASAAQAGDGVAPGMGAVEGVVVDQAIRPVADAAVGLAGAGVNRTAVTGADGGFRFADVAPGTYVLSATHLLHAAAQTTVDVREGEVATAKLLAERLFTQEAYHETVKFDGFIQCGYAVSGVMSSVCVNDYTHFVGPYTCPECEHLFDSRSTDFAIGPGWQAAVFEMTWSPSAQGTSPEMRLIVSFFPRDASHAFCSVAGPDPILIRMELGVECAGQQGDEPSQVPPEGMPNMHMFAATNAPDGMPASVAFSQTFSVFMSFFYYGAPPPDWSFLAGDPYPF